MDGSTLSGPAGFTYALEDSTPVDGVDTVRVGIRPEDITLVEDGPNRATVTVVEPMGNENFLYMELDSHELTARIEPSIRPREGEKVAFAFEESALYLFDPETGESLKTKTDAVDATIDASADD